MQDEKPAVSRFLRYPICTVVSFCLVLGLCLECFLTTTSTAGERRPGEATTTMPPDDAAALVDLRDFRFLLNNLVCVDAPVLLVLVTSTPLGRASRDAVRATWAAGAKTSNKYKVLFLLGQSTSPEVQSALLAEDAEHHDLVQGSFLDVAANASYKHAMALKWTTYHCPKTRVLLKVDDQTFVNARAVVEFFSHDLPSFWTKRLILCNPSSNLNVERNSSAERYVPEIVYPSPTYPPHCRGDSVAYSPDMALALYRAAQKTAFFPLDDVHFTGTLAQTANVTLLPFGPLWLDRDQAAEMVTLAGEGGGRPLAWMSWVGPTGMSPEYALRLWNGTRNWRGPLADMHVGLCPFP